MRRFSALLERLLGHPTRLNITDRRTRSYGQTMILPASAKPRESTLGACSRTAHDRRGRRSGRSYAGDASEHMVASAGISHVLGWTDCPSRAYDYVRPGEQSETPGPAADSATAIIGG